MFDSVPWFVGGGAQHSPEVARLLAYAATGGSEGVVTPPDLKVVPKSVPSAAVSILPGAGVILNRATGGDQQSYVARMPTETEAQVAATGSGEGRSDLIVMQIEDPFMAGEPWQNPDDPKVGPYVFVRVISNVPAETERLQDVPGYAGRSAVALARIDIPASTGTITGAMIKDLRKLANPRQWREMFPYASLKTQGLHGVGDTQWEHWPSQITPSVRVPDWATEVAVTANLSGIVRPNNENVDGSVRLVFGDKPGEPVKYDVNSDSGSAGIRFGVAPTLVMDVLELRGQMVTAHLQGQKLGPQAIQVDKYSSAVIDIQFQERVV